MCSFLSASPMCTGLTTSHNRKKELRGKKEVKNKIHRQTDRQDRRGKKVFYTFSALSYKTREKRLLASSYLSVRQFAWNNSVPSGWIFMKFAFGIFRNYIAPINVANSPNRDIVYLQTVWHTVPQSGGM